MMNFEGEVKDPISRAAHPCFEGNCLPELQYQLIVVFTGKTIMKQLVLTLKPFVFKFVQVAAQPNPDHSLASRDVGGEIAWINQLYTTDVLHLSERLQCDCRPL